MGLPDLSTVLLPPFDWCEIPAGKVTIEYRRRYKHDLVEGQQTFDVAAYVIAKYPITNAQYRVFMEAADGYKNEAWWNYSIKAQRWRTRVQAPRIVPVTNDTAPRTQVTWVEAIAFCRWLTSRVNARLDGQSNFCYDITLPTEQQWQHAAQGDCKSTKPIMASLLGMVYMPPNVYEWCLTTWEGNRNEINRRFTPRVVKNLSHSGFESDSCQFIRARANPLEYHHFGFRAVCRVEFS